MKVLDDYNRAKQAVYTHIGFAEDWTVFPICDRREFYWAVTDDVVTYAPTAEGVGDLGGPSCYVDDVLEHRHYPKAVWPGARYTGILVETASQGNRFLALFDNAKRLVCNETSS